MKWDKWRKNLEGKDVFYTKFLFTIFGVRFAIHKMVGPDTENAYHTHPAKAIRVILWGGYSEDIYEKADDGAKLVTGARWFPGKIGLVKPSTTHRVSAIHNGRSSYSLWIRFKETEEVQLVGTGWKTPNKETLAAINEDLSNAKRYNTVEELMDDLFAEDDEE